MSDVEIAVQAEGVEDAVGEVPPGEEAGMVGGGDGAGGGGGFGGGKLGKILGVIGSLLAFGEDIFKVVGVVSSVLRAFLAPVAVLLLRLLAPTLRALLSVLPIWFDIMEVVSDVVAKLAPLLSIFSILNYLTNRFMGASLGEVLSMLIEAVKKGVQGLGKDIAGELRSRVFGGNVNADNRLTGSDFGAGDAAGAAATGFATGGPVGAVTNVVLQGGLSNFVERAEKDSGVETP